MESKLGQVGSASRRSRTPWHAALGSGLGALALCVAFAGSAMAAPAISLSPNGLDFGSQPMDTHSSQQTIQLANSGDSNLAVTDVRLVGANAGDFVIMDSPPTEPAGSAADGPASFVPGAMRVVSVVFSPSGLGSRNAYLSIASNATSDPVLIPLTGRGMAGDSGVPVLTSLVTLSAADLDFGSVPAGQTASRVLVLTNTGTAPVLLQNINLVGDGVFGFSVSDGGNVLQPGESRSITVQYAPGAGDQYSGILIVFSNAVDGVVGTRITGSGS